MIRSVKPPIDPAAHKAAMDSLEAQRAAYRRFARAVESQRATLNDGDGDRAAAVTSDVTRGFSELQEGARKLKPAVDEVRGGGSAEQIAEMQRQMESLMREAREAENAIHNLSLQLEAWRDAYGRQLAEFGLAPGSAGEGGSSGSGGDAAVPSSDPAANRRPYVQPGFGRGKTASRPTLIDRRG